LVVVVAMGAGGGWNVKEEEVEEEGEEGERSMGVE